MSSMISLLGLVTMLAVSFLLSSNRKKIQWSTIVVGVGLQVLFGLLILKTDMGKEFFVVVGNGFKRILDYTQNGSSFIFGSLADGKSVGFVFATMVLPTIIFTSSLMSVLYHLGIMQWVVEIMAKIMVKTMKISGAEALSAAANIFAGQTEAPLVIKPYVDKMTRSELLCLMTGGMATVAGGVLAAYVGFGIDASHLLAASVMSAPAAVVCSKLLMPETEESVTQGVVKVDTPKTSTNVIDAAASGASEGLKLAANVGAMLLAFIALVAMLNGILSGIGGLIGFEQLSFEWIMGHLFAPVAWLIGCPWEDCLLIGNMLGKKLVLNEFVAYLDLKDHFNELTPRGRTLATYALCGFANFSSIAIQVGGVGTLAPNKRGILASLGVKSLIGGTLACLMTACVAGLFI